MMYAKSFNCLSEKAKILVKQPEQKRFSYKSIKQLIELLQAEKELYSLDENAEENRILCITEIGLQNFYEITTMSGSRILLGKDAEICVDTVWITTYELEFHEKIDEYDLVRDRFHDTIVLNIEKYPHKLFAYQITAEKDTGIVVNSLLVRFIERDDVVEEIITDEIVEDTTPE